MRRNKGWWKPPNTIYVGRPPKGGNPFRITKESDAITTVAAYRSWLLNPKHDVNNAPSLDDIKAELRGKNLACWCPLNQLCHADVLLEIANS